MLLKNVEKYYDKSYDLNCAETILYAANEEYKLNLSKDALKIMAAFGGGMGIEDVCGAITGALAVLGILFVEDRGHESDLVKNLSKELFNKYNEEFNCIDCLKLKEKYKTEELRCSKMVYGVANMLDEIVENNKENIV